MTTITPESKIVTVAKALFATVWERSILRAMLHMPKPWVAWLAVLVLVNLAGGRYYFGSLEGKLVVAAFLGAIIVMEAIFRAKGFVRLLGLGHIFWVPLVPWLALRLDWGRLDSAFALWVAAVVVLNTLSLIIDAIDVVRYARGERAPTISGSSNAADLPTQAERFLEKGIGHRGV